MIDRAGIGRSLDLKLARIACNQSGWVNEMSYFQPGGSSIIDWNGKITAIVPPRFVFEHLRPELAIGDISRYSHKSQNLAEDF
jgi:hypothetical protein